MQQNRIMTDGKFSHAIGFDDFVGPKSAVFAQVQASFITFELYTLG